MIYPVFNSKEFDFCRCDIYSIVNSLGNDFLISIYMRDQSSYFILDTSIYNDKNSVLTYEEILKNIVESIVMRSQCVRIFFVN